MKHVLYHQHPVMFFLMKYPVTWLTLTVDVLRYWALWYGPGSGLGAGCVMGLDLDWEQEALWHGRGSGLGAGGSVLGAWIWTGSRRLCGMGLDLDWEQEALWYGPGSGLGVGGSVIWAWGWTGSRLCYGPGSGLGVGGSVV